MTHRRGLLFSLIFALILAGCDRGSSKPQENPSLKSEPAANSLAVASKLTIKPEAHRPGNEKLATDTNSLMQLVIGKHDEISPISINSDGVIAMHPGREASSWIEFDTSKLRALDLYPAIRINGNCRQNAAAGIVGFNIYSDGMRLGERVLLNRDDRPVFHVELNGSKKLRLEVDKGNDQVTCDWFSIGVDSIEN